MRIVNTLYRDSARSSVRAPDNVIDLICKLVLLFVAPEVLRVIVMCMSLVEIPEPVIKALPVGDAGAVSFTQTPFSDDTGSVAGLFEQLGNGNVGRPQRYICVTANQGVSGVQSRH